MALGLCVFCARYVQKKRGICYFREINDQSNYHILMLDILGYNKNVYLSLCWWVQALISGHFLDTIVGKHGNFVQKTSINSSVI